MDDAIATYPHEACHGVIAALYVTVRVVAAHDGSGRSVWDRPSPLLSALELSPDLDRGQPDADDHVRLPRDFAADLLRHRLRPGWTAGYPAVPDQEHLLSAGTTNKKIRGTLSGAPDLVSDVSCVVR